MPRRFLALIASVFLAPSLLAAGDPAPIARFDRIAQEYASNEEFMGAVLVARGAEVLFSKAYGYANLELQVPNTTDTKFRIGSVTKQFTAAAILLLEERGKLRTGDPIKKFYAAAPAAWDAITLAHLLTHTAGLANYSALADYPAFASQPTTPAALIERFRDEPLDFAPGTRMRYSNSGYTLLGLAIEKASGASYGNFLAENLFRPLGLKDTGYGSNEAILPRRAAGYERGAGGWRNAPFAHMSVSFSAGALYSTVGDLHRWNQALYGGKVLTPASLAKMLTPPATPGDSQYALGLNVVERAGRKVFEHSGGVQGFNCKLSYYPADALTVVVLANISGRAPADIVDRLGAVAHGETVTPPKLLRR